MKAAVLDSLGSWQKTDGGADARFSFDPALPVFAGHFPGKPLVPGVLLIEAARVTVEQLLGRPLFVAKVRRAKFSAEVLPGEELELSGRLSGEAPDWRWKVQVSTADGPAAQLDLALRAGGA